jgi:hypothetical protein
MSISHDPAGTASFLLDGDIDLQFTGDLDRCIVAPVADAQTVGVVIDLADVPVNDCVGIASVLIGAALLTPLVCSFALSTQSDAGGKSATSPVSGNTCPPTKLKPMTASEAGKRARLGQGSGDHG